VWSSLEDTDALVIPSKFEPYGVVVLEALAGARPVLASDQVIAALDRDDGSGAIVFHHVGDSDSLAQQIQSLLDQRDLLMKRSLAARAIAEKWAPARAASILQLAIDKAERGRLRSHHQQTASDSVDSAAPKSQIS
jgi:glycosyltransferase involved in cell wall biosynthesis